MKKLIIITFLSVLALGAKAQDCCSSATCKKNLNDKAENIVGVYQSKQGDDVFKARVTQQKDGTFKGQIFWLEKDRDANGNKALDEKNPDKSLRSTPCDEIVLFTGLKYNAKKKRWDDTKIYDPQRGIKAHMQAEFTDDGQLKIKGTVLGIGETVYWKKLQ